MISKDCGEKLGTEGRWPWRDRMIGAVGVEPEGAEPVAGVSVDGWPFKVASWASRSRIRCWLDGSGAVGAGSQDCMI